MKPPAKILHLHSTFTFGGKAARAVRLMNGFGNRVHHTILSGMPEALSARESIDPGIAVNFPKDAPSLLGKPSAGRYRDIRAYLRQFDLVLSYNWGAMQLLKLNRLV